MALAIAALAGCAIDVDLSSSPSLVPLGGTVNFDIAVTNRTTCPVGGVVALLFPFIPKDLFINEIDDPDLREQLSSFVDAFCTGADVEFPDGAGGCRLEDGELFCDFDPTIQLSGPISQSAVVSTAAGDQVTCGSDGQKITCRFPRRVVDMAMAQQAVSENSLGSLQCLPVDGFVACGALLLDPNETKSDSVSLDTPRGGLLRNWVVSFATVNEGVCTGGILRRRPCEDDDDCAGATNVCGSGICIGGDDEGFGCEDSTDCESGVCDPCEIPDDDNQVLSGVECTTTSSGTTAAPAASQWGMLLMVVSLCAVGAFTLRKFRTR